MAKSFLPAKHRLHLDPPNKLFFPCKQRLRSATACAPPRGILAPGESLIATVFKFVEHLENNEKLVEQRSRVKFKIVSLKVKGGRDYVPELGRTHKSPEFTFFRLPLQNGHDSNLMFLYHKKCPKIHN
ncbi:vesicle-associated protein 4-2-like [Malania oleifera]|uniref:vesicle-associated protein 4-2-like n=1 Tax=Malania oleifera TaxID=397392 RepID=UPI0025AEB8AB|nr:vesicle-associated protein 4-2-like [Malania oleifera]